MKISVRQTDRECTVVCTHKSVGWCSLSGLTKPLGMVTQQHVIMNTKTRTTDKVLETFLIQTVEVRGTALHYCIGLHAVIHY